MSKIGEGRLVDLQVENGGFDRFLVLVAQLAQAVDEGVGDAEFHNIYTFRARSSRSATFSSLAQWFK